MTTAQRARPIRLRGFDHPRHEASLAQLGTCATPGPPARGGQQLRPVAVALRRLSLTGLWRPAPTGLADSTLVNSWGNRSNRFADQARAA